MLFLLHLHLINGLLEDLSGADHRLWCVLAFNTEVFWQLICMFSVQTHLHKQKLQLYCILAVCLSKSTFVCVILFTGVPARPNLTVIDATEDGVRLRCEAEGAHRRPEVVMVNSSGHVLSSEEPQVSEANGRYNVTILTTIKETGLVRCRVKQKEISHEAFTDIFVYFHGKITPLSLCILSFIRLSINNSKSLKRLSV